MKQYKVTEAVKQFNAGNYEAALEAFTAAAAIYGEKSFDYNIKLCKQRLSKPKAGTISSNKSFVNEYFDHVYLVNLPQHTERRLKSAVQLRQVGIEFELFTAINGYVGAPREAYDAYLRRGLGKLKRYAQYNEQEIRRGKPFIESPGAVGYIYTYLSILQDAKAKGYKRFLILEDDVILCRNFDSRLRSFVSKISQDWKILQLGASQYGWESVNEADAEAAGYYYPRRLDTCGSFAIAFDHSVIDDVIAAESAFDAPFDHLPMGEIYERHLKKNFVAYPNLVMPDVTESSIRGKRCQFSHAARMKWAIDDFDYPLRKPSIAVFLTDPKNAKYISAFSKTREFPLDLRVYCYSEDGPRPVHDFNSISGTSGTTHPVPDKLSFPPIDFCSTTTPDISISDRDLVTYVEHELGLKSGLQSPLGRLDYTLSSAVTGRVSVIIPTYKRPDNLRNALVSVVTQDYQDLEVIVVNDNGWGSEFSAETRRIVEETQQEYPARSISLIEHNINRNGAAARNTGFFRSTGEYICFLDDDDIYLQGRVSRVVERLRSTPKKIGAAYCGFLGWNSSSNDLSRYAEGDLSLEILQLDYKKHYLHTNTATYKREAILAINGFDESYRRHQDLEFNLRFFDKFEILAIKETLVRLNPVPSAISNKIFNRSMLDLKIKFLKQFDHKISSFGEKTASEIYSKHWREVVRYISDKESFLNEYVADYKNGAFATIALLEKINN